MFFNKKIFLITLLLIINSCNNDLNNEESFLKWNEYLGDKGRTHYSSLKEINLKNIDSIKVAWTYNSGDLDKNNKSQIQCSPIVIDTILYGTNPKIKITVNSI